VPPFRNQPTDLPTTSSGKHWPESGTHRWKFLRSSIFGVRSACVSLHAKGIVIDRRDRKFVTSGQFHRSGAVAEIPEALALNQLRAAPAISTGRPFRVAGHRKRQEAALEKMSSPRQVALPSPDILHLEYTITSELVNVALGISLGTGVILCTDINYLRDVNNCHTVKTNRMDRRHLGIREGLHEDQSWVSVLLRRYRGNASGEKAPSHPAK